MRGYAGVASYDREAHGVAARACIEAARTRDDLADIVNAGIEELLRCRRELPAFGALLRLARSARTLVNRGYHRQVAATLTAEARTRLAALLMVPRSPPGPDGTRSRQTRRGQARSACASTWPISPGCGSRQWQWKHS